MATLTDISENDAENGNDIFSALEGNDALIGGADGIATTSDTSSLTSAGGEDVPTATGSDAPGGENTTLTDEVDGANAEVDSLTSSPVALAVAAAGEEEATGVNDPVVATEENGDELTDQNQTITATTTATSFVGGAGNDTLVFPTIPSGSAQLLSGTVPNAVISLGEAVVGTPYAGTMISNIENLTFDNIQGPTNRTLTINGDAADNIITVTRTVRETNVNGGDGDDTINFTGATIATSEAHRSIVSGGTGNDTVRVMSAAIIDDQVSSGVSGDDTYIFGSGKQELRFGANSGNDTITNFSLTDDVLDFSAAGVDARTVTVTETDGNTVFTINGTSTVTVEGVNGMQFGTHWTAQGDYTPPAGEEPAGEPGVNVSNLNLNISEDGATDTTEVSLNSRPTSDVTITLGSDGGVLFSVGGGGPSATPTLTFTPDNWNQPQTVTVTAIDDADYEPGGGTMIYFEPISTQDPAYREIYPPSGWATITDNEAVPDVAAPEAQAMSADIWEDNPVAELQGNGYSARENGIVEYRIISQPVEGGTVTMTDDRTFRFEGDTEFLTSLNRGETAAITFEYAVSDGEVWSQPGTMTFNVHGFTNGADETYQAFTRTTPSQVDFLALNGGDGNDTVVFNSITVTSGEDVSVGLDQAFHWTEYAGKSIINTENITIKDTNGDTTRRMTVSGNDQANVITIENTDHRLSILGRGGDDTINFNGTGNGRNSVINGGAGNDTINAYSTVTVNVAEGNDAVNVFNGSNVTVQNFTTGDRINFAAGIEAGSVSAAVQGPNTVFTINQDGVTSTVTVLGATGLEAGTDWTTGGGTETPPTETPPAEPAVTLADATVSEAAGAIEIPVSLSHASTQDVTLTYEVTIPAQTITFDGLGGEHSAILAGYEGLRWTGISASGDGAALTATTGGGTIQALAPGELSLTGLTVSTASTNQVVTIEAIRSGEVVGTQQVLLGNGGPRSSSVSLGSDFANIDAVRIDGNADAFGNDYPISIDNVVLSGTQITDSVMILAGETEGSITVPVTRDGTLSVRLTEATGATLGTNVEATGTITNDDPEPLPMISMIDIFWTDIPEGLTQEFELTRDSRIGETLTVELESSLFGNQSVTFEPGEAKVRVFFGNEDDDIAEPNQPYEIRLASSPNYIAGATSSVSGMYIDNDGGTLNTAPTASSAVTYIQEIDFTTYGGSYSLAAYGNDAEGDRLTYALVGDQPANGTISFDPDVGAGALMFTPNAGYLDTLHQGQTYQFTYQFTVSDGEFTSAPATGQVNIFGSGTGAPVEPPVDQDQTITATTTATGFVGGAGNDTLLFARIPAGSAQLLGGTVANAVISLDGTIVGTPYAGKIISNIENLTFDNIAGPAGRTLTINGDARDNTITVNRTVRETNINGGDGNDTIKFNGATVATSEAPRSVISGGTGHDIITVSSAATIDDRVSSGASGNDTYILGTGRQELRFGADSGNDTIRNFSTTDDVLNFAAAGVDASTVIVTETDGNTVFTINGTSTLTVQGVTGLQFGTHWTAEGTYVPPTEEPPLAELAVINAEAATAEVTEGDIATFTFTRTGDLSQPLTVGVDTSIGTAVLGTDFTAPSTITFAAGSDTATLAVQTINDGVAEEPATIAVRIIAGEGYAVGAADGNVTELLDAPATEPEPVLPSLSINDVTVSENAGTALFTVTLSAAAVAAVSVDYATTLASGPSGSFLPASGTLTFEPGETTKSIAVGITDNTTLSTEAQRFVVSLMNASGTIVADPSGEGTILDDDLPAEMPALVIETTTGLDEHSTISWNAIPGAASYVLIGIEPDEPNFPPHTLGFAVAPNTSLPINGNDEFTGMVVTIEARDAEGNVLARSENQTDLIANVNDEPTGRPVISDNTPTVGDLLTISIGDLEDGDGMRADRPDEFGYLWERSTDGVSWALVSTTDSYRVTEADTGYVIRGAARYQDRGDTIETVYSLTTATVGDLNPNTPPVAFDDTATTAAGAAITIDALANDFDFEDDAITIEAHGQPANGAVIMQDGMFVYTPWAGFVGTDVFNYTLNGGDTGRVTVTVTQADAALLTLLTVDNLDENSTLSWTAVPGAVSYVFIGLEPDDPTAPPHELGFALAPATSFNIGGDDEFVGMAIHIEARDANGVVLTRSVNETGLIENINDIPTGNLGLDDMTPEVGQVLRLDYGTFEDGDGYRDRGREDEFQWAIERSQDGVTWATITTGVSAEDGPFELVYTVTQADAGQFLRGRAIYEDRAGDTIETVYSLSTSRVVAAGTGGGDGGGDGSGPGGGEVVEPSSLVLTRAGDAVTATELGADGSFTVALADAPTADVTVTIMGDNQVYGQAADGAMELVFTPENWSTPQTVTVVAIEDGIEEGLHTGDVWLDTISDDPRFNGLMEQQAVDVIDSAPEPEEPPYVTVANLGGDVTEGGEMTFTFHRSGGSRDLSIMWEREGGTLDADDIAAIRWNGVAGGFEGFRGSARTATMTIVLRDDTAVEGTESVGTVRLLPSSLYMYDDPFEATGNVLDNDVAQANSRPVVESMTVELTEDQMTTEITPLVTDADGDPVTIQVVGTLPDYVSFNDANQSFLFNGEASAFDYLNDDEMATIEFQFVGNDGTGTSDAGTITININGITDPTGPQIDQEPAPFADPYNYDQGNGGLTGRRTAGNDILNDDLGLTSSLNAFGGNDTIYGRDLNDLLTGGNGNDTIYGGSGDDQIHGDGGGTTALNGGAPGEDLLYGGDGVDTLNGNDGNDTLVGGHGADSLIGGRGDDTFVFLDILDRGDTIRIQGQGAANDVFDFRDFDFGPNEIGRQGPVTGFQLFNQTPVEGQMLEDAFYYDRSTGRLSLNTGSDGLEDFHVTLFAGDGTVTLPRLNADDFLI